MDFQPTRQQHLHRSGRADTSDSEEQPSDASRCRAHRDWDDRCCPDSVPTNASRSRHRDEPGHGSCQSTAPNLLETVPAVADPARAWAASFFPSFQDICYAFRGILEQKTPHLIRIYRGFVGFSGSTKIVAPGRNRCAWASILSETSGPTTRVDWLMAT